MRYIRETLEDIAERYGTRDAYKVQRLLEQRGISHDEFIRYMSCRNADARDSWLRREYQHVADDIAYCNPELVRR